MGAYWFRRGTQSQISMGQKPVTAYQSGATIKFTREAVAA